MGYCLSMHLSIFCGLFYYFSLSEVNGMCRNWPDDSFLERDMKCLIFIQMIVERRLTNLRNQRGNVFIFYRQKFLRCL